jgi:hypothetical protein
MFRSTLARSFRLPSVSASPASLLLARPTSHSTLSFLPKFTRPASSIPARGSFSQITPDYLKGLLSILESPNQITTSIPGVEGLQAVEKSELDGYNEDWMGKYKGNSGVVVKPKTAKEVAEVVSSGWLPSFDLSGLCQSR